MCGITGIYSFSSSWMADKFQHTLDEMTDSLVYRGPDSRGTWVDFNKGIGLGHRRLAIRDLSENGNQPMRSSCGRYVIVYNGEVYSHEEISKDLLANGRYLRGTSDTEVILEAFSLWGIQATLGKMIGMFALAVYDNEKKELTLVRDRIGIKPLYWGKANGMFVFGSELKAIRKIKDWQPVLDRNSLASFMRHNYIPAPHTIYQGIYKLDPGSILQIGPDGKSKITKYWDFRSVAKEGLTCRTDYSEEDYLEKLDILLRDAVRRRMVSDVPLGTLLSGGIDSSLVTALMAEQSDQPIHTFTIGFPEKEFNEAIYASKIANHLNTKHTELYVEPKHALDLIDKLPYWYDEPFADSSQLPTLLVSELTKKHVTVVLSGDGGDELFAGYNRYTLGLHLWRRANFAPYFIRKMVSKLLLTTPVSILEILTGILPESLRRPQMGNKLHKFANAILLQEPDSMYMRMLSHWTEPDNIVIGAHEYKGILWDKTVPDDIPDFLERMQFLDTLTYLPDDILTKVDRATMSVSLEARVPLLDHRIVEMAWSMPKTMKIRNDNGKWALRQLLYRRVPQELIDRPKMGFAVPFDRWLRGPLKSWAESLLEPERLRRQQLFTVEPVLQRWQAHLNGENWGYPIWNVLMAQAWIENNPDVVL